MKKILNFFFTLFIFIILFNVNVVLAKEITIDDVLSFMSKNNILDDSDYFYMYKRMFNGAGENNINKVSYTIDKQENTINVKVTLKDVDDGDIVKDLILNVDENGLITYTNNNDIKSLDSRVGSFIFSQILYSIGGARGYNKDILIDWMNQIDLTTVSLEEGIEWTYENIAFSGEDNGSVYEYDISVPKTFKIDINKITEQMPESQAVEVLDIKTSYSSISMKVYAKDHLNENCVIYRRNSDNNDYEKLGVVSCNNGEFVDNDLSDGTVYYYQATVEDAITCAQDIKVTTEKIPLTGAFITLGSIVVLIILEVVLCIVYKKRKIIQKI